VAWSHYLEANHQAMRLLADDLFGAAPADVAAAPGGDPEVTLIDFDPDAEVKVVTAMLLPHTHLPEQEVEARVDKMSDAERLGVVRTYAGDRTNRRHRPGRALERAGYRFEVLSDYGAFRDLQRHRLLTIEWQDLSPLHGYTLPAAVVAAGAEGVYRSAMDRSARLYQALGEQFGPTQAAYAVALAFRVRYTMQFNAREAMHLLELRTTPQGHPEYRKVGQQMHRLIATEAGHPAIAALMAYVDDADYEDAGLERLAGERRAEARRLEAGAP
jgi:hypothetical protein